MLAALRIKDQKITRKPGLPEKNYKQPHSSSTTRALTSLFNYEPGEFIYGGLARACQSGNSRRIGFPVSNFPKFVAVRLYLVGCFGQPCRRPRCNLSRFSNHRRTNQRGGYEKQPPFDTNAELRPPYVSLPPPPLPIRRQVNDVKLATIIKLQRRSPLLITASPGYPVLTDFMSGRSD